MITVRFGIERIFEGMEIGIGGKTREDLVVKEEEAWR